MSELLAVLDRPRGRIETAPNRVVEHSPGPDHPNQVSDWRATVNGTRTCSVDKCSNGIYARKLCKVHYRTAKLRGDFTPDARYGAAEALAARVEKLGDCLIWTGSTRSDGYGQIKVAGKSRAVHQVAWEFANGPIPEGMEIDHTCFNHGCVNVEHLRLATRAQNNRNLPGARSNSRTGVRNVSANAKGFQVQLSKAGRLYHFGTFATVAEAQVVAEAARAELFGDFAGRAALGVPEEAEQKGNGNE